MATTIHVEQATAGEFRVSVTEGNNETTHRVTVRPEYHEQLTGGAISGEELVRRSFEFLLEREPKESILHEFDLSVIARYFPEYEKDLPSSLHG